MKPDFVYSDHHALPRVQDAAAAWHAAMPSAAPSQQTLYLTEPGTSQAVDVQDINQGHLGDCYLLSAIGEIAKVDPAFVTDHLIHGNPDGTETVTLYRSPDGQPLTIQSTEGQQAQVVVNNATFSADGVNCATSKTTVGDQQEIWPQVIENAYALLNGGYAAIGNGGYDVVAMETLTGQGASYTPMARMSLAGLTYPSSDSIVEIDTRSAKHLDYGLVSSHAYMFDGLVQQGGTTSVKLLNPWGTDEPSLVPWSRMSHEFSGVTIGHV